MFSGVLQPTRDVQPYSKSSLLANTREASRKEIREYKNKSAMYVPCAFYPAMVM